MRNSNPGEFTDIGVERTLRDIPLYGTSDKILVERGCGVEVEVEVRACYFERCRTCSYDPLGALFGRGFLTAPVPAASWHEELQRVRVAAGLAAPPGAAGLAAPTVPPAAVTIVAPPSPPPGPAGGTSGPPPPGPPPGPGPGPASGPATGPTLPPTALSPIGGNIRMCHKIHLNFDKDIGIVRYVNGKNYESFEKYFIPEDSAEYKFGGPLHSVTFPEGAFPNRGNVRDVMACTYRGCRCHRRHTPQSQRSNVRPWCHRRHLTGGNRVIGLWLQFQYVELPGGTVLEAGLVEVDGYGDGMRRRAGVETCVEGTCKECDEDDAGGGEVGEKEGEDDEMGEGGEECPEQDPSSRPTYGGKTIGTKRSAEDDGTQKAKKRRRRR